jgi:uncharacterized protein (DUF305 family)
VAERDPNRLASGEPTGVGGDGNAAADEFAVARAVTAAGPVDSEPEPAPSPVSGAALLRRWGPGGTGVVAALAALVLLVIGATAGIALFAGDGAPPAVPTADSVDAGFAQDMIVHHRQGVLMAHLAERQSDDPEIQRYAYDMAYTQTAQIGQMEGWLALWGLAEIGSGPHMAWMTVGGHQHGGGSDSPLATTGLMPGMATDDEIDTLKSLHGKDSDVYFLQLMIRHHEGGTPMMEYAARRATNSVVRNFAQQMLVAQSAEVRDMTTMLHQRGAAPIPYTAPALPGG